MSMFQRFQVLIFVTNVENNVLEEAYSMKLIYHDGRVTKPLHASLQGNIALNPNG